MVNYEPQNYVDNVRRAMDAIAAGNMVIMVDDEDRENEGDLVFAADHSTPEMVNFMAKEARGLICLTLESDQVEKLNLPQMNESGKNLDPEKSTAFTVSIEAKEGVTTGISAADRHKTIIVAANPDAQPEDIVVPGHIFPLKAQKGGVLERAGHTEGSVDLARLAGCQASAVICEIMNDDGTMARMPDLINFSQKHEIPIVSIADLIAYRMQHDQLIEEIDSHTCHLGGTEVFVKLFKSEMDGAEHICFSNRKEFSENEAVHVRVHSQQSLLDTFDFLVPGQTRLNYGLSLLESPEPSAVVYLTRKADTNGLSDQFRKLTGIDANQPSAKLAPKIDQRSIGTGAQIIRHLGIKRIIAHMTQPKNIIGIHGFGLDIDSVHVIELDK